jgi:hypothetical protein
MELTFDDSGPLIFVGIDKIVHEGVELTADAKLVLKNDLAQFLEEAYNHYDVPSRTKGLPQCHPPYFLSTAQYAVACQLS